MFISKEQIECYVQGCINKLVEGIQRSFDNVKVDNKLLKAYMGGVQSNLDKFKNEIENNGVFKRLNNLEHEVFGSDTKLRLEALENYLKIVPVQNMKDVSVIAPGLHYEKKTKTKKTREEFEVPF